MVWARLFVSEMFLNHFVMPAWVDPFLGKVLLSTVVQVLFGSVLLASNKLSAKAGSLHHGLSLPGLFSGMARFDMGPFSFFVFGKFCHFDFHVHVILAVLIKAVFNTICNGLMLRIPIFC